MIILMALKRSQYCPIVSWEFIPLCDLIFHNKFVLVIQFFPLPFFPIVFVFVFKHSNHCFFFVGERGRDGWWVEGVGVGVFDFEWLMSSFAFFNRKFAEQLNSIRRVSMARILCDNGDDIQSIQPLAFFRSNIQWDIYFYTCIYVYVLYW